MFEIIPYRNPHTGKVFLLTPTEAGIECIIWFGSWADFETFLNGLGRFKAVEESHGKRNIPAIVLDAFGEEKEQ